MGRKPKTDAACGLPVARRIMAHVSDPRVVLRHLRGKSFEFMPSRTALPQVPKLNGDPERSREATTPKFHEMLSPPKKNKIPRPQAVSCLNTLTPVLPTSFIASNFPIGSNQTTQHNPSRSSEATPKAAKLEVKSLRSKV